MSIHVIISLSMVTVGIGLYLYMLAYMKKAKNVKLQFPIDESKHDVIKDIVYKSVPDKELLLDIYQPLNSNVSRYSGEIDLITLPLKKKLV